MTSPNDLDPLSSLVGEDAPNPVAEDADGTDGAAPDRADGVGSRPFDIVMPARHTAAVVFASPHSGRHYPAEFIAASRLDSRAIRRSEDAFVEELFAAAPRHGAPLIHAHVPRAYVDLNRDPFELDPGMFVDALPDFVNTDSPRVAAGLGTVARVVASGEPIYRRKLLVAEALERIEACHRPYHAALVRLIADTRERFGGCLLVDCHSMPSVGRPGDHDAGGRRVDIVLGDRHGASCAPAIVDTAEAALLDMGFLVRRNAPYAGGYTTRHYGQPANGVHALQIEINRALYMDESRIARGSGFTRLAGHMDRLARTLAGVDPGLLAAP